MKGAQTIYWDSISRNTSLLILNLAVCYFPILTFLYFNKKKIKSHLKHNQITSVQANRLWKALSTNQSLTKLNFSVSFWKISLGIET